jgi:hypothetical protein
MSYYFKLSNPNRIKVNEKFVVKIVGWNCQSQQPDSNVRRTLLTGRAIDIPESVNLTGGMQTLRNGTF